MMEFRPNRGCHEAIRKLNGMIEGQPTSYNVFLKKAAIYEKS
ncbi:MAG: hypothetical protein WCD89_04515 [Anaerocolumna sp.]